MFRYFIVFTSEQLLHFYSCTIGPFSFISLARVTLDKEADDREDVEKDAVEWRQEVVRFTLGFCSTCRRNCFSRSSCSPSAILLVRRVARLWFANNVWHASLSSRSSITIFVISNILWRAAPNSREELYRISVDLRKQRLVSCNLLNCHYTLYAQWTISLTSILYSSVTVNIIRTIDYALIHEIKILTIKMTLHIIWRH